MKAVRALFLALCLVLPFAAHAQVTIFVTVSTSAVGVGASQSLTVAAAVQNDPSNAGVTWTASGNGCAGSGCGSFTILTPTSATYNAPASGGVYTITATSVADITRSGSATLGVTDLPGVLTYHNNLSRDGTNTREFVLTPSKVTTATFGKLFSCQVDGAIYAQPLWVPRVIVAGGQHNVLVVATQHDSVYAIDADTSPCLVLWHANLLDAAHGATSGETPVASGVGGLVGAGYGDITPEVGVTGTPVIDVVSNRIYVVGKSVTTGMTKTVYQRLHALDLGSGNDATSPRSIDGTISVAGNGDGSVGGQVPFDPLNENQRPGLVLSNGIVYVSWASHEDKDPYHGWVIGFDASTLAPVPGGAFNTTPNHIGTTSYSRGGIWMGGGAPAIDSAGYLYVLTGNGTFNANVAGGTNYGDSVIKLSTTGGLSTFDYFSPSNESTLDTNDTDLGSGGAAILIDQPSGPVQHLLIGGGKDGRLFLLNRDSMGRFNSGSNAVIQTISLGSASFATPAFWQNSLYIAGESGELKQFVFNPSTGLFGSNAASQSVSAYEFPGATASVSSSGTTNGIVWALDNSQYCTPQSPGCGPAVLHAYDATNLGVELWNSSQAAGQRDQAGRAVKFVVPTVVNGKVYVGTRGNDSTVLGELDVYGLIQGGGDFTISAGPASQTVAVAGNTSYSLSVGALAGFGGTVGLSVKGLPSGATGTFTPASVVGSGLSTLQITTDGTAAVGTYTLTVTGTSGALSHSASVSLSVSNATSGSLAIDKVISADGTSTIATPPFSTSGSGELILAFVASDGPSPGKQTVTVSGAGLSWTLVKRTNTQAGTSEIWRANAANPLTNVTVTSTPASSSYVQSLTVITFIGSSGVGASAGASGATGAPTVTITTTQQGSLIYGVGNDWDRAVAHTPGTGQVLLRQYLAASGDTFWFQNLTASSSGAGVQLQLNDTAPTNDQWNLEAVEILASGPPPPPVAVPNVVNLAQAAATTAITSAGLTLGTVTTASSQTVAAGLVISQNPTSGTLVAPGSSVNLVVSSGPAPVAVPNVVAMTQAAATTTITSAGLTVGTVTTASSQTVASGSVISESPVSGTLVAQGSAVNLVVSTGPPPLVSVPNVVGMTQANATTAITGAGLAVGTVTTASSTTVAAGLVISQNPAGGASVSTGSAVALVISTGPPSSGPVVDASMFSDGNGPRTITFTTATAGDVIVAFAASDGPTSGTQTLTISGGGLTWTLVKRVNAQRGVSEIWTATAASTLVNAAITSTASKTGYHQSFTLVAFAGASGVGASATASAASGGPAVTVTTTKAGSLVFGVGNDWDTAVARVAAAGQTLFHQWVDTSTGDTYWVQSLNAAVAAASTAVKLSDTSPTIDRWNFAGVEILSK